MKFSKNGSGESFWHETTHYALTREQEAKKQGRHPSCIDNRTYPLCGNGSYHAKRTVLVNQVTCLACIAALGK